MTNVAVVLIGALSLINLLLTFAVIRQVRRIGDQSVRGTGLARQPAWHIQVGQPVPAFTTTSLTGASVSLDDFTGARSVIGFFGVGCGPCRMQLPLFVQYAKSFPGGADQVLAVVMAGEGSDDRASDYFEQLAGLATIVAEPTDGPASKAFMVTGYPTYYVLDEQGRVENSGMAMSRLMAATVPA
jgi:thiol-disulfide isomerase/thioredoxin